MIRTRLALLFPLLSVIAACGLGVEERTLDLDEDAPPEAADLPPMKQGIFLIEDLPVVSYAELEEGYLLEGDMLVPRELIHPLAPADDVATLQSALITRARKFTWTQDTIPYEFAGGVTASQKTLIREAMAQWEGQTPVKFVPWSGQANYLRIRTWSSDYSYATVGMVGGRQFVTIQQSAFGKSWGRGLIAHELGHAMGLFHEQSRPDRDDFVTIHWGNIRAGFDGNFSKHTGGLVIGPYDVGSLMHYGSFTFSKSGSPTITRKNGTTFASNYKAPTAKDLHGLTVLYDTTPPTAAVSSPKAGATVSGIVQVAAAASDDFRLAKVELSRNGVVFATRTAPPFTAAWDTTTATVGTHALTVRATDVAGNVTTSAPVTVTVRRCDTSTQRLTNPGFEGAGGWTATTGVLTNTNSTYPARTGSGRAILGGAGGAHEDRLRQTFTLPASACGAELTAWVRVTTAENPASLRAAGDWMRVELMKDGVVVKTLAVYAATGPTSRYLKLQADLDPWLGQEVKLRFRSSVNGDLKTVFSVDDVRVVVRN